MRKLGTIFLGMTWMLLALEIPQLTQTPTLDGVLKDNEWKQATRLTNFVDNKAGAPTKWATEVRLGTVKNHLYIAFRSRHPDIDNILDMCTEPDSNIWTDDVGELFIDPTGEKKGYYQFLTNTRPTVFDQKFTKTYVEDHSQGSWDSDVEVACGKDGDAYVIECRFSLATMDWGKNISGWVNMAICRTIYYCSDRAYVLGKYHNIDTWTPVKLQVRLPIRIAKYSVPQFIGNQIATFDLMNITDRLVTLQGNFDETPIHLAIPPKSTHRLEIPFQNTPGVTTHHRMILDEDGWEAAHFFQRIKVAMPFKAYPLSSLVFEGEPVKIKVHMFELPQAPPVMITIPGRKGDQDIDINYRGINQKIHVKTIKHPWKHTQP